MTNGQTEAIEIHKTIPRETASGAGVGGSSHIDGQGRWTVQLDVTDDAGLRMINLHDGDTFDFDGGIWQVINVKEPTTAPRGAVATIKRVS